MEPSSENSKAETAEMPGKKNAGKKLDVGTGVYLTSLTVILLLMIAANCLTLVIPGGEFVRSEDGTPIEGSFAAAEGGIPFWKWLFSPVLVLGSADSTVLLAVIAFLLVIGGIFNALSEHSLMQYMLDKITWKFGRSRYRLLAATLFFFMAMGALIGSFEECVPLVPIAVALSAALGWDRLTGVSVSLLAVGCGFASGVCNPFTVGVAQTLIGLPMFSGVWLRAVAFVLIYLLLLLAVFLHAKRVERPLDPSALSSFRRDGRMDRGLLWFSGIVGFGIATVLCSGFLTFLRDYTMIVMAVAFLLGGTVSTRAAGMSRGKFRSSFGRGVLGILPAVLMILMASSIKFTLESAKVLDTILYSAVSLAGGISDWSVILFLYLTVLVMNFFIPSGSAKAFMLIPLIVPLAARFGISPQLCILAFAFGDGFSNVFYPTNPALLISLGLADVSYAEWFRHSWKFQLSNLILTAALLLFGLAVGY